MAAAGAFDTIVVGGGPAGAVMAWSLAARGIRVAVVDRANFPRDKVCGDFVEPAGLRILRAIGCMAPVAAAARLPIETTRIFIGPRVAYHGNVPYNEARHGLPPHGGLVPRHDLDTHLLRHAQAAGATVFEGCAVTDIARADGMMRVAARGGRRGFMLRAPLVVGADGTESIVARRAGLWTNDRRYTVIAQRGYAEGVRVDCGEATIGFDDDIFPGYGWMFPMPDGRVNVGVGVLAETCHRFNFSVPRLLDAFLEKLRRRHPACAGLRLTGRPVGGVVRGYGAAGQNHFTGGLLIGDAGSFVDPMTGEGITPGMESALLASATLERALAAGRFDAAFLASFERDFRRYFDPAMRYLDLCATMLRNRHFRHFWLETGRRMYAEASVDTEFARVAGATFGGLDVRPLPILAQIWTRSFTVLGEAGLQAALGFFGLGQPLAPRWGGAYAAWARGWRRSLTQDPGWTMSWLADLARASRAVQETVCIARSPRVEGDILNLIGRGRLLSRPDRRDAAAHPGD